MKLAPRTSIILMTAIACLGISAAPTAAARPHHRLLRQPKPVATPIVSPPPTAPSTRLGRPQYEAAENVLIIPYTGDEPAYTRGTMRMPPRVYFDFDADAMGVGNMNEVVFNHPTWLAWALTPRGGSGGKPRITITLKRQSTISVVMDARRHALLLVPAPASESLPTSTPQPISPTPAPSQAIQATVPPTPVIETPSPAPVETPAPTPKPTMPPPKPAATPAETKGKATRLPVFDGVPRLDAVMPLLVYDQGNPAAHLDTLLMPGLVLSGPLQNPEWSWRLDGRYVAPAYTDAAGIVHARQETWLTAGAKRKFTAGSVELSGGLGYLARFQRNVDASLNYWQGPELRLGLDLPVIDGNGWAVQFGAGLLPYLSTATGWTWGHEIAIDFEIPLRKGALDVGYRRFGMGSEIFQGPYVQIGVPL